MLGYSYQVTHKHAELAADPYARYAARDNSRAG